MPLNQEFPILDGVTPSWTDIICRATPAGGALIQVQDIQAIDTAVSMEIGEQKGASGGRVLKRTTGSAKFEASMILYYSGYVKLLRELAKVAAAKGFVRGNQVGYSLVHFGIEVQFSVPNDSEIYQYRIKGCRLTGRSIKVKESIDAQLVECSLNPLEIVDVIDGKEVVPL
jgi:hypothetical protein